MDNFTVIEMPSVASHDLRSLSHRISTHLLYCKADLLFHRFDFVQAGKSVVDLTLAKQPNVNKLNRRSGIQ